MEDDSEGVSRLHSRSIHVRFLSQTEWQSVSGMRDPSLREAFPVQRPPFRPSSDPALRSLVFGLQSEPARSGRNDGRAGPTCRPLHCPLLGRSFLTSAAGTLQSTQASSHRQGHMDETYTKARGRWMYLYCAVESVGDTVEFFLSENRDLTAAKHFLRKALRRHGRPDRIVIDGNQTNLEAISTCDIEDRLRERLRRARPSQWRISAEAQACSPPGVRRGRRRDVALAAGRSIPGCRHRLADAMYTRTGPICTRLLALHLLRCSSSY